MTNKDLRIIFMGTPEFAVASLDALHRAGKNIVAVITSPDKPAGRGRKLTQSAVKQYALSKGIDVLQPEKLKNPTFIEQLKNYKADLQIVVAFRMLPEMVWNMPPHGTFNLHASLLPHYRGAAPINHALINGETETGVTTFFIEHQIDTGNILYQEKVPVTRDDNAGSLHDKLMTIGAGLVVKTVNAIENNTITATPQTDIKTTDLKKAPKIFKEDTRINWYQNGEKIYNFVRGLSPYPAAFSSLLNRKNDKTVDFKIYKADFVPGHPGETTGSLITDDKTFVKIALADGYMFLREIQLAGKKRLPMSEVLKGFKFSDYKLQQNPENK